jgi:hypothetical protein
LKLLQTGGGGTPSEVEKDITRLKQIQVGWGGVGWGGVGWGGVVWGGTCRGAGDAGLLRGLAEPSPYLNPTITHPMPPPTGWGQDAAPGLFAEQLYYLLTLPPLLLLPLLPCPPPRGDRLATRRCTWTMPNTPCTTC